MKVQKELASWKKEITFSSSKITPVKRRKSDPTLKCSKKNALLKTRNFVQKSGVNPEDLFEQLLRYKSSSEKLAPISNISDNIGMCKTIPIAVKAHHATPVVSDDDSDGENTDFIDNKNGTALRKSRMKARCQKRSDDGDVVIDLKKRKAIQTTPNVSDDESDDDESNVGRIKKVKHSKSNSGRNNDSSDANIRKKKLSLISTDDSITADLKESQSLVSKDFAAYPTREVASFSQAKPEINSLSSLASKLMSTDADCEVAFKNTPSPTDISEVAFKNMTSPVIERTATSETLDKQYWSDQTKILTKNKPYPTCNVPDPKPLGSFFGVPDKMDVDYNLQCTIYENQSSPLCRFTVHQFLFDYNDVEMTDIHGNEITYSDIEMVEINRITDNNVMDIDFQSSDVFKSELQIYAN